MSANDTHREHGFVLVWMAIMLTTLLATSALAIEWNHISREGARMQKAADAAALAGAVYLPENFDTGDENAVDTAIEIAAENGYTITAADVSLDAGEPTILKVTITEEIPNLLGTVVGSGSMTITRSARAQYSTPLPMGSPGSHYGNDPELLMANPTPEDVLGKADGPYPNFWSQVAGGGSKWQGKVKLAADCNTSADLCPENDNSDYTEEGWIYQIDVLEAGAISVEIYDPAWVNDLYCGHLIGPSGSYTAAAALDPAAIPGYPDGPGPVATPAQRYAPNLPPTFENPFCTDDNRVFHEHPWGSNSPPLWTTYELYGPGANFSDATRIDDDDGGVDCTADFPGVARTDHNGAPLPIDGLLKGTTPITDFIDPTYHSVPTDLPPFGAYYRAWWELCTFTAPEPGTYFLRVQSLEDVAGDPVPGVNEVVATNHFSIRAFNTSEGPGSDSATVAGWGMMTAWMSAYPDSALGDEAEFYLLRLEPADHAQRLVISTFDMGDFSCVTGSGCAGGPAANLTILPPEETQADGNLFFDDCTYTDPVGRAPVDARPLPNVTPITECKMSSVGTVFGEPGYSNWRGKWVDIVITVPAFPAYSCDVDDPQGCWLRLHFDYDEAQRLHDGVAVMASVDGDPVRLLR